MLVEIDHEHLILRITGAGKGQSSGNHVMHLRPHASTVVNHQADRDRDILVAEILNPLWDCILVNMKVILAETRNKMPSVVLHGGVQDHQANTYPDRVRVARAAAGRRAFLRAGNDGQSHQETERREASVSSSPGIPVVYSRVKQLRGVQPLPPRKRPAQLRLERHDRYLPPPDAPGGGVDEFRQLPCHDRASLFEDDEHHVGHKQQRHADPYCEHTNGTFIDREHWYPQSLTIE